MGQTLAQVGFCLLPGYQHGADTGEAARVWWCSSGKSPGQTGYASESAAGWCSQQPAPQCWSGITPSPSPRRAVLQSRDTSPVTTCSISPSQALLSPGTSWHSIDAVHQLTELIAQQGLCSPGEHQPLSSAFPTTVVVGLSHTRWCQLSAVWGAAEPRGVDAHTVPRLPPRLPWSTSRVVPQQDQAVTPSGGDTSALAGHFAENGQKLKRESAGLRG